MSEKISEFVRITSVDDAGVLTVVQNGQNFQISQADYLAGLGVTGTIVQEGDVTGTPILDVDGTVNKIRNVEDGPGIISSVSPENGLKLQHNFTQGIVGSPVLINPEAQQPTMARIAQGSGISVTSIDDRIVIDAVSTPVASSTVIISQLSDFPAASGGTITLADNTDYFLTQDVTSADNFELGNNCVVRSSAAGIVTLTYSGVGDMFIGTNKTFSIQMISVSCATGNLFNIAATVPGAVVQLLECQVTSCVSGGTINGQFITRLDGVSFLNFQTNGILFTGSHQTFIADQCVIFLNGGAYFDFGTATFNNILIGNQVIESSAGGTTFISGSAGSANINAGGLGSVQNTRITGSATALSGITSQDALWNFALNDRIEDTRTDGLLSMQGNATATVIASAGVGVLVAGTWVVELEGQMTGTTGGRLTYNGGKDARLPITASITIEPVSGGTQEMGVMIAVNGSVKANSLRTASAAPGSPVSITGPWQEDLSPTDYVEVFVTNESGTTNVLISSAISRVN